LKKCFLLFVALVTQTASPLKFIIAEENGTKILKYIIEQMAQNHGFWNRQWQGIWPTLVAFGAGILYHGQTGQVVLLHEVDKKHLNP
jgi:hypothetical protein